MQNIFIGNNLFKNDVVIDGNLEVKGTTTIINTDTLQIKDGLIGVNIPPVSNRDSGILIEKNYNDITDAQYTGLLSGVTLNTATVSQTPQIGYIIEAAGQKKLVTFVSGNTVTVSDWSPLPNIGDAYNLYTNVNAGFFYKPSTNKFYTGFTYNNSLDYTLNINPGVLSVHRIEQSVGEQVWYVGKHGHDSLSGRTIGESKLTFNAASGDIICLDSGIYNETVTVTGYLYAPNATINGIIMAGGTCVVNSFNNMLCTSNNYIVFNEGSNINVTSGKTILKGNTLNGTTALTCNSAEIIGHVNYINSITAFNCENGVISVSCDRNESINLANTNTNGIVNTVSSKINSFLETGTGFVYAADAKKIVDHINNTNNPHNVTLNQLVSFVAKGDLITYNGTNHAILSAGTNGQALVANNILSNGLEWVNIPKTFMLHSDLSVINTTTYTTISYFTWNQTEFSSFANGKLVFNITVGSSVSVRLYDGLVTYATGTYNVTGFYTLNITNPVANTVLLLQVMKAPGTNGNISGVSLIF